MTQAIRTAKAQRLARISVVLGVLFALSAFGVALSNAAPPAAQCNGVFDGETPVDISKTADKTSAVPGETVTYTFSWEPTGSDLSVITDCHQVDDADKGNKNPLNALVEPYNVEIVVDQVNMVVESVSNDDIEPSAPYDCYDNTRICIDVPIPVPNDPDLIGHKIYDRGKLTRGNAETRTNALGIDIVEPPCTENCGGEDGSTDDGSTDDGSTDDGSTDDGSTDDGSTDDGSTDDGSTDGTPTDDGSTDGTPTDDGSTDGTPTDDGSTDDGTVVQGTKTVKKKQVLAQTGPETTMLSIIGSLFLMLGLAMRYGYRPAFAANTQAMVSEAIRRRNRNWTCKG